jgi:hypothetical protein
LRALARATPDLSTEPRIDRVVCTPDQLGDARGGDEPDIVIAWRRDLKQELPWAHKDVARSSTARGRPGWRSRRELRRSSR